MKKFPLRSDHVFVRLRSADGQHLSRLSAHQDHRQCDHAETLCPLCRDQWELDYIVYYPSAAG